MTLTQAQQEAKYDAERSGQAYVKPEPAEPDSTLYPTPIPLSAQEEIILRMLLELSEPDPDELPSHADVTDDAAYEELLTSVVTRIGRILCESDEPPTPPANPSALLTDLLDWAKKESATEYAARFAAGYRDGQAITHALLAEQAAEDDRIEIERFTRHDDGSIPRDPWTRYTLGEASIDVTDSGSGGNIVIGHDMLEFHNNAQLLDLAALLSDERVLEAIDPSTPE